MLVEAQYRDGHKEKLILAETTTLAKAVETARAKHPASSVKFLKVIDSDRDHRRINGGD